MNLLNESAKDLATYILDYYKNNRDYKNTYELLEDIIDSCLDHLDSDTREEYIEQLES